jgi:hypothetical protein
MQRNLHVTRRELSPILDHDTQHQQQPPFDASMLSTFSPLGSGHSSAALPSAMENSLTVPGPLPNPGFSFGNNDPSAIPPDFNDPSLPLITPMADHHGMPSAHLMYRDRVGSMASMFSQGTVESLDTIGEWETPYNYGTMPDQDAAKILHPEDSLCLPVEFDSGIRRASA